MSKYAEILLEATISKTLDYKIPEHLPTVSPGMRVSVPVRGHMRNGIILHVKETSPYENALPIHAVDKTVPLLSHDLFPLAHFISKYYCTPLSQVLKIMVPASIRSQEHKKQLFVSRKKSKEEIRELAVDLREKYAEQASILDVMLGVTKGILLTELLEKAGTSQSPVMTLAKKGVLTLDSTQVDRSPLQDQEFFRTQPKTLSEEQQAAFDALQKDLVDGIFSVHLLHGVTGSGKTEIYLQSIQKALELGKTAIMLVPEIALTEQTIDRFRSRFEGNIAILHHRLSQGERHDEWHRIQRGEAHIVIGARSAVFSPVNNLGLIIVDEEHESSYKQQEEMPCYHARDVAVMRAKLGSAVCLLGSATPSLESYYNAMQGKYHLSTLTKRPTAQKAPLITLVDMKKEFEKAKGFTNFSDKLLSALKTRIALGEQSILFLNRRGYHTQLLCKGCGEEVICPHCDVPLTFHKSEKALTCHLCTTTLSPPPTICPSCKKGETMKFKGVGTEQIEKQLQALFPEARVLRMDRDTTKHKGAHGKLARSFASGKADILIGTQMIAKGLHFPEVTLVGILNADPSLQLPDFKASEISFQLITQVAGRAGRGETKGEVILQTTIPENRTIELATKLDYKTFYEEEMAIRALFEYPPYSQMVKVTISGADLLKTEKLGIAFREKILSNLPKSAQVLPLTPCGYPKIKDRYRFQFLMKDRKMAPLTVGLEKTLSQTKNSSSIKIQIDVNPTSTFN